MIKQIYLMFIILLISTLTFSQEIYWATKVDTVTSEYSPDRYGSKQILGVPNVDIQGRFSPYAWAVEPNEIDKEFVQLAYIVVSFDDIYNINQIAVFESYNPGVISLIYISPFETQDAWKLVYADTSVISRSCLPEFQSNDMNLRNIAGTRSRRMNPFKKDSLYISETKHNILNVFLDNIEPVKRIRIVINPLAMNGWNQIDAIGITNSKKTITFPKPLVVDQSLIIEPNSSKLATSINSQGSEIVPLISPDGKRIYYSKKEFIKKANIWTQNIWYSDLTPQKQFACNKLRNHNYKNVDIWQNGNPIYWEFNSIIPHTIVGFSAKGDIMYISGLYEGLPTENNQKVFANNTNGLSISKLDSTFFKIAPNTEIQKIDSVTRGKYYDYQILDDIMISCKFDSLYQKKMFFVQIKTEKNNDYLWSNYNFLGTYEESPFSFIYQKKSDSVRYWIAIDSVNIDSTKIAKIEWGKPQNVIIEDFVNTSNYINFYITPDNKHLLLSLEDENSKGQRDIYLSELKSDNKTWSKPKPLSDVINTIGDESSPFLDGDNTTLYFSSTGHNTYGEHDVFVSYMIDNDWTKWTIPQNLGSKVNTPGDEINFRIEQKTRRAYFATYEFAEGCKDKTDIFSIMMGKPITINIKGRTLNVNDNYEPIENVLVSLNALEGINNQGIRHISFYSGEKGVFNIKINKMIEANKMTKFGLSASKFDYKQTDKSGKKIIPYVEFDFSNPDWVVNIYTDLYLLGPKFIKMDVGKNIDTSKNIVDTLTNEIVRVDTVIKYIEVGVTGNISVDTSSGCPFFYYAGKLYNISMSNDKNEPAQILEVAPSYTKHFDYNKTDVSLNEKEFQTLKKQLFDMLSLYDFVNIFIQSSASQVPTTQYCSNFELARMRSEEVENRLLGELKNQKISKERVYFDKRYVVEGEYNNDPENKDTYKKYQYVKVWIYSCPQYNKNIK